jgi:two-component system response regulator (stage 0 sporulation protein F)
MTRSNTERILIVAKDEDLRTQLVDTLGHAAGYTVNQAGSFQDALSQILHTDFDLIITEAALPDLSGIDLLTAVSGLRPGSRVMVIDDDLTSKSAVTVFRLGAADYLYKPLNLSFVLMQVERQMEQKRHQKQLRTQENNPVHSRDDASSSTHSPDPLFRNDQLSSIEAALNHLFSLVQAGFVGLVDRQGNLIRAAGSFNQLDLTILMRALSDSSRSRQSSASMEDNRFFSTHFQSEGNSAYIIEFSGAADVSLVVICNHQINSGMIWSYSKRTAAIISEILQKDAGTQP